MIAHDNLAISQVLACLAGHYHPVCIVAAVVAQKLTGAEYVFCIRLELLHQLFFKTPKTLASLPIVFGSNQDTHARPTHPGHPLTQMWSCCISTGFRLAEHPESATEVMLRSNGRSVRRQAGRNGVRTGSVKYSGRTARRSPRATL